MSDTKYDNPLVAGFGTATADEPPAPAQQHLDATDGEKVSPVVRVQENTGAVHDLDAAGEESGKSPAGGTGLGADGGEGGDDYDDMKHAELQAEIDRRNEGLDESEHLNRNGSKKDLAQRLRDHDEA